MFVGSRPHEEKVEGEGQIDKCVQEAKGQKVPSPFPLPLRGRLTRFIGFFAVTSDDDDGDDGDGNDGDDDEAA